MGAHQDGRRRSARRPATRHLTQIWLAASDDPEARTTGGYWHHQHRTAPHPAVGDQQFQNLLLDELARYTGTRLPLPKALPSGRQRYIL